MIFNVNFKTVSSLIKSAFVGVRTLCNFFFLFIFVKFKCHGECTMTVQNFLLNCRTG